MSQAFEEKQATTIQKEIEEAQKEEEEKITSEGTGGSDQKETTLKGQSYSDFGEIKSKQDLEKEEEEKEKRKKEEEEQVKFDFESITTLKQMDAICFNIGTQLCRDRQKLSEWVKLMQEGFCAFYIQSKSLFIEAKELEILKDFLGHKVETLNTKLQQMESKLEDLEAQSGSNQAIKEHLMRKVRDLESLNLEKSTILIKERREKKEAEDDVARSRVEKEEMQQKLDLIEESIVKEFQRQKDKAQNLQLEN